MENKLFHYTGAILIAIASVALAIRFIDWQIALCAIFCCITPLSLLIGVNFKFKSHEWLGYTVGVFIFMALMLVDISPIFLGLPLLLILLLFIIIRICKKEDVMRMILIVIMQVMMSFLFALFIEANASATKIADLSNADKTISNIQPHTQTHSFIKL